MDDIDSRLGLLARLGGALGVTGYTNDLEDQIRQGALLAYWIQTGELPDLTNPEVAATVARHMEAVRRKPK